MIRTHWWLRSYSSQALEGYKLKAKCLFLISLELLFALPYIIAIFGVSLILRRFLILNLIRLHDAWMGFGRRAETKEERKRTRTTKQYTSKLNSSNLVE